MANRQTIKELTDSFPFQLLFAEYGELRSLNAAIMNTV